MKANEALKQCILSDDMFILADYKLGDKVLFTPKLTGYDNSKVLTICSISIEAFDIFGNEYEVPMYVYHFENMHLSAYETQLIPTV